ncbi:hypothetical protein F4811DRAFT_555991 [Daldinia bambusicola]|nr:hypothetical protein F4811DRAFT_555991 [Daldinia bambusicola]
MDDSQGFTEVSYNRRRRNKHNRPSPPVRRDNNSWQEGEIVFFKLHGEFSQAAKKDLIHSGYLDVKATGHPVIVLEKSEDSSHYLVTTISAYSSGSFNNYLPPWEQVAHRSKYRAAFRAFRGSVRPNTDRKYLELEGNASLPKPKTSWVYARSAFVVPSSTLKKFEKVDGTARLTEDSLMDLLSHLREDPHFRNRWTNPKVVKMLQLKPKRDRLLGDPKPEVPMTATSPGTKATEKSVSGSEVASQSTSNPTLSPSPTPTPTPDSTIRVTPSFTWSSVVRRSISRAEVTPKKCTWIGVVGGPIPKPS